MNSSWRSSWYPESNWAIGNSLEQLCINLANERLQQYFVEILSCREFRTAVNCVIATFDGQALTSDLIQWLQSIWSNGFGPSSQRATFQECIACWTGSLQTRGVAMAWSRVARFHAGSVAAHDPAGGTSKFQIPSNQTNRPTFNFIFRFLSWHQKLS